MKSKPRFWTRAQGLVEFALILPLLLLLIFGIIEMGRLLAIYSSISSGARQAVRYGSVAGDSDPTQSGTQPYYLDCSGIRDVAQRASPLVTFDDVQIAYDHGGGTVTFASCPESNTNPPINTWVEVGTKVTSGDRILVAINATYYPIVPLVPIPQIPLTFQAARSIFTSIIGPTPTPVCPAGDMTKANNTSSIITSTTTMTVGFTSAITLTVKNDKLCPISGFKVNLSSSGPATPSITASGSPPGTANGSGVVTYVISTTVAGTYTFNATPVGPTYTGLSKSISIVYKPGPVNAGTSTVVASPTTIASDGLSKSTVTVTLKDAYGNALGAGKQVSLDDDGTMGPGKVTCGIVPLVDYCTITAPSGNTTNASGQVVFKAGSTANGSTTFQAVDVTDSSTAITQKPTVTYIAGAISALNSTVIASTSVLTADNTSLAYIVVTLRDGNGNLVITGTVSLSSDRSSTDVIAPATATAVNASGMVTFTVKSNTAGGNALGDHIYTPTATDAFGSIDLTPVTITFIPAAVSVAKSTVTTSPSSVPADGVTLSTITVTLLDSNGQPVSGKMVTIASSRPLSDTITPLSGTTNASGQATFTTKSSIKGTSAYTATDTTDGIGGIVGTPPANQVSFTSAGPDAATSTFVATPSSVQADGADSAILVVTLKNSVGAALQGWTVTVTSSRGAADTITVMNGTTNSSGQATFTVVSSSMGTSTFTATISGDPLTLTATVNFVCVTGSLAPLETSLDTFLKVDFANGTGITRRLTKLVITWPNSLATRALQNLNLLVTTIWSGSSNVSPITIDETGPEVWNGNNRTINNAFSKTLTINYNFAVPGTGNYIVTATWDNGAGGSLCTTPTMTISP